MRARAVLVGLAAVGVVIGILVAIALGGDSDPDGGGSPFGLPAVEGRRPPTDYRIVYRVTTEDAVAEEEHVVHRPFDAHIIQRRTDGTVTSERWSTLGALVTRSQGADPVRIDTAVAIAASDLRPDRFSAPLADAGKVTVAEAESSVGGRACRTVTETDTAPNTEGETIPITVARCVDAIGLVLDERWTTQAGDVVLTKRARVLEVGDDVPEIDVPDADPLPDGSGNGAINEVPADEAPPFARVYALDVPDGFTFVGRYAVVPARVATGPSEPTGPVTDVALYTDVWRRGPDVLLLDQGATKGGAAPFDPDLRIGTVALGSLGSGELALDLRSAEVRATGPDNGFVRLSGTIPLDELITLAMSSLHVLQEVP